MGKCLKNFGEYNPLPVGCSPWFSPVVRELQSCLASALPSVVIPRSKDRAQTAFGLAEKGDKSLKVSFQRGAILINRSLSYVLLEGTWSR